MKDETMWETAVKLAKSTGRTVREACQILGVFRCDEETARMYLELLNLGEIAKKTAKKYSWKVSSPNYANGFRDRLNSYNGLWTLGEEYGGYGIQTEFTEEEYEKLLQEGMPDIFEKVVYSWEREV